MQSALSTGPRDGGIGVEITYQVVQGTRDDTVLT